MNDQQNSEWVISSKFSVPAARAAALYCSAHCVGSAGGAGLGPGGGAIQPRTSPQTELLLRIFDEAAATLALTARPTPCRDDAEIAAALAEVARAASR
jgi:hypothetical protein